MGWVSRADEMGHVYIGQLPAYCSEALRASCDQPPPLAARGFYTHHLSRPSPSRHPRHPSPSAPRCCCCCCPSDSPEQPNHTPSRHAGPMIAWRCLHILSSSSRTQRAFRVTFFPTSSHANRSSCRHTQSPTRPLSRLSPLASPYLFSNPPAHLRLDVPTHASSLRSLISFSPIEQALS
ncbi:hypothetical protein HETIRDRAFT_101736 [Heterobasidion irregulare TC 32-1]|uniref:Uncharacterized protein n=1 Tax=Heterobasidion irregulare (strain TC 32-1) TaxID=747525 RepID=W4K4C7_HETIT|nr:uncharacterized protein HETIRDRAFT_101736 [Heterobasidion irregulare TC 32-1]ETW80599.1 hypothetical protein HETIRDRAFT_101736 [Heterobasidion irregulare TC 32-1]